MTKRNRNREHVSRYVSLEHWLMRTEAWRSLNCVARCVYLEIKIRYMGSNNGRIPFSLLELAKALNVSKATAMRALRELQAKGFVVITKRGGFNLKVRHATEWRLTEHSCNVTGALPTKEFTRWRANEKSFTSPVAIP